MTLRRRFAQHVALGVLCAAPGLEAKGEFAVPRECGNRDLFAAEIRQRLGSDEAAALLDALELTIAAQSNGYSLGMRVGNETRQLEDPHCGDLFRAAVVVAVALWEEPRATAPEPRKPAAVVPKPGPPPAAIPKVEPVASPVNAGSGVLAPSAAPEWILAGEIGANWGLRPELGPLFGLRGAVEASRFGAVVAFRLLPPNESLDENRRGVAVSGLGAGVGGYVTLLDALRLELGISTYRLSGSGVGSRTVTSAALTSFGPHLGLRVTPWSSAGTYVALGAEGHLELLRLHFEIREYGEVFRIPWGTATGILEVGYRFR